MDDELSTEPEDDGAWLAENPATVPEYPVNLIGIPPDLVDPAIIESVIRMWVEGFSRFVDLSQLDGITVATDYPAALADLDRGYETMGKLTATSDQAMGVGMTPCVLRDGVLKSHIVMNAEFVLPLLMPEHEDHMIARNLLAHECVHVFEHMSFEKVFPGYLPYPPAGDYLDQLMIDAARFCWAEYLACRLSASFHPEHLALYEQSFRDTLETVVARANTVILRYRTDHDLSAVLYEVGHIYVQMLSFGSYLLGHLAGIGKDISGAPTAAALLDGHMFAPFFKRLEVELTTLFSRLGKWTSIDEFLAIGFIARDLIAEGGIFLTRPTPDQLRADIPCTPATMPKPF